MDRNSSKPFKDGSITRHAPDITVTNFLIAPNPIESTFATVR